MLKGDEINRSSMILRGDLVLDVQEEKDSGRVRVNVLERSTRKYVAKAHVKVIGEGNSDFVSGDTDLRGVFVADDIKGRATVIARHGDEYAFYRGKTALQGYTPPPPVKPMVRRATVSREARAQSQRADLRKSLRERNRLAQGAQADFVLNQIMSNQVQGQDVYRVKF